MVAQLRNTSRAIAQTRHPDATKVMIVLASIIKNLTAAPGTPQQVAELERYLREDDVIPAAEELPRDFSPPRIREPLPKALAALKA